MDSIKTRRNFLKVVGAAGLSAATLPFARTALAATAPRRVIFVYTPDGAMPDDWHAQGAGTTFTLPAMTAPLERVRQHCVFLSGLNMIGPGGSHEGGVAKLLTGTGGAGTPGMSLDYYLGQQFRSASVRPHLNLNIVPIYTDKHITYDASGIGVVPEMNPLAAFESLFGASATTGSSESQRTLGILKHVEAEIESLRGQLGADEKTKLDTHMESLRELEQKLVSSNTGSCGAWNFNPTGFAVTRKELWQNPEFMDAGRIGVIADLHTDVAVHALACDLTRVVTLKWNNSVNEIVLADTGTTKTCHGASHEAGADFVKVKAWYMERFARLIEALAAVPEDGGTMLDNTLVFHGSCLANGSWHNHDNMPFIVAGGAAAGIVGGRALDFGGVPHNKLLVSIARFMGVDINSYGDQDSSPGPLPGLMA